MDWCGYEVLTAAIDMRVFLQGKLNGSMKVRTNSFPPFSRFDEFSLKRFESKVVSDLRYVRGVIKAMLKAELPYAIQGMDLQFYRGNMASSLSCRKDKILVELPANIGLGSSAAMCVTISAVVDLLHRFQGESLKKLLNYADMPNFFKFCAETAYRAERIELNVNCGPMDPYASAYGDILYIDCSRKPVKVEKYPSDADFVLVIGDTNQPKDTLKILAWLGKRYNNREALLMKGVSNVRNIITEAKKELDKAKPDINKLGELMNENQHYLAKYFQVSGDCPISPSRLDQLIESALKSGALGAKLSGSGGGGCIVALCDRDSWKKVKRGIEKIGAKATRTIITKKGVRIETIFSTRKYLGF